MTKVDIEDRGIRIAGGEQSLRLRRGGGHQRNEPCGLEHLGEQHAGHWVVLDDEDHPCMGLDLIH